MTLIINLKLYGKQLIQSLRIVFRKVLLQQKVALREKLWYNHFQNFLSPPSLLRVILMKSFHLKNCNYPTDTIDMDELVLVVKSLSSYKASCNSNPKTQ
jgi:hypothetical protein